MKLSLYPYSHRLRRSFSVCLSRLLISPAHITVFELVLGLEVSNVDSPLHNHSFRLTMTNHRLADLLGGDDVPLIRIVLRASHRFLLMSPACLILLAAFGVKQRPYSRYYTLRFVAHRYIPVRGERSYVFVLPSFRSSRPRRKCMTLYPNSQRHLHIHGLLFILPAIAVGLPPVCIPYRRFEMPCCIEISNTDSTSYPLGLTLSNHRLADRLGSCGVLLICIFLRASHRLLLMFPRMSDLPYRLWGQPIAIFLALHLALRGAHESQHPFSFHLERLTINRISWKDYA